MAAHRRPARAVHRDHRPVGARGDRRGRRPRGHHDRRLRVRRHRRRLDAPAAQAPRRPRSAASSRGSCSTRPSSRGLRTGEAARRPRLLTVGPLKIFIDGSLNTRTAFCCATPTPDCRRRRAPPALPTARRAARADRAGGPARHRARPARDRRPRQHARARRVRRSRDAGPHRARPAAATPPTSPGSPRWAWSRASSRHTSPTTATSPTGTGPGAPTRAFAYADLHAAGAPLEFGSDAPVAAARPVGRHRLRGHPHRRRPPAWHPEQALPLPPASRRARAAATPCEAGDPADLVVAGRDLRDLPPSELRDLPIVATVLDGRITVTHAG